MSNAIPLASVSVFLGEDGHPDGHSTGGVFKLGSENIGQLRSAGGDWDTYAIKFGSFFRFGIVFVDRDSTSILVVFCSRVDEFESEIHRAGHNREGTGERWTGGRMGGEGGRRKLFYRRQEKIIRKRHAK